MAHICESVCEAFSSSNMHPGFHVPNPYPNTFLRAVVRMIDITASLVGYAVCSMQYVVCSMMDC